MDFSCLQENLKEGLSTVSHIAMGNTTLPILNNVLISVKKGDLSLTATNLEIGIRTKARAKVKSEGSFTLPAQLLSSYVNFLPNKQVDVKLEENIFHVSCGSHKTKIKGISAEEFPLFPEVGEGVEYSCKIGDFKRGAKQVLPAVSSDEYRPEISGVFFKFETGKLIFAGTDSYRLAEKEIEAKAEQVEKIKKAIVPAKTLQELLRVLDCPEETMKIFVSENQILFSWKDSELISRTISGQYPDYKQIIPTQYGTKAVIDVENFVKMVKSAGLFSQVGLNDIQLKFEPSGNKVIIESTQGQSGESVSEIDADIEGKANDIVFNYRYFLDGLGSLDCSEAILEIIDNNNPGVLRPARGDGYAYIIMPIRQ